MPLAVELGSAKRILIYGVCGSGKTTLAEALGEATGLPWHSVDDLAWLPGWVNTTEEHQREVIEKICAGDSWILDTAYGAWLELPRMRADIVVALDYPRWFSFLRLMRRTTLRIIDKKLVCNGNRETLRNAFSHDSILLWHFKSFRRKRDRIRKWSAADTGPPVLVLRNQRETTRLLDALGREPIQESQP